LVAALRPAIGLRWEDSRLAALRAGACETERRVPHIKLLVRATLRWGSGDCGAGMT
jgi:hypothetical protein